MMKFIAVGATSAIIAAFAFSAAAGEGKHKMKWEDTAEMRAKAFAEFDADESGTLSDEEYVEFLMDIGLDNTAPVTTQAAINAAIEKHAERFAEVDIDEDGKISEEEFAIAYSADLEEVYHQTADAVTN